jgi:glucose-6-phosphate dehydrogenase assembly protein OpcA
MARSLKADAVAPPGLGTTWRQSTPQAIESDLTALWSEAAKAGPLSRALMSNLVVVGLGPSFPGLEEVARAHPARTILLGYTGGVRECSAPLSVRVGVTTFGEPRARYGVETIAVEAACAPESIPSIVRALAQGDVPTAVWWAGDLSSPPAPVHLTTLGRQLVFDSRAWRNVEDGFAVVTALAEPSRELDLADLNWRRLVPLRRALVDALRAEGRRDVQLRRVHIEHAPGESAAARLVSGWLAAAVPDLRADAVLLEESPSDAGRLQGGYLRATLSSDDWSLSAVMAAHCVAVHRDGSLFTVAVPQETGTDAVALELRSLHEDAGYRRSIATVGAR